MAISQENWMLLSAIQGAGEGGGKQQQRRPVLLLGWAHVFNVGFLKTCGWPLVEAGYCFARLFQWGCSNNISQKEKD